MSEELEETSAEINEAADQLNSAFEDAFESNEGFDDIDDDDVVASDEADDDDEGDEDDTDEALLELREALGEKVEKKGDQPAAPDEKGKDADEDDGGDGIRSLREAYKKQKQELAELRKRLENPTSQQAKAENQPVKPKAVEFSEKYSTEDILDFLGKFEAGVLEGDEKALEQIKNDALEAIELKSPAEILEVLRKAQKGGFGEVSRDVQAVAAEALATVQVVGQQRQAQVHEQQRWQEQRKKSIDDAMRMAGVKTLEDGTIDASTPEGKAFVEAGEALLSQIPSLAQHADAPLIVGQYLELKTKAERFDSLQKENEELKARLRRFGSSIPKGGKQAKKSSDSSPEAELAEAFKMAGIDV